MVNFVLYSMATVYVLGLEHIESNFFPYAGIAYFNSLTKVLTKSIVPLNSATLSHVAINSCNELKTIGEKKEKDTRESTCSCSRGSEVKRKYTSPAVSVFTSEKKGAIIFSGE